MAKPVFVRVRTRKGAVSSPPEDRNLDRWTVAWAERELKNCKRTVVGALLSGSVDKSREGYLHYLAGTWMPVLEQFLKTGVKPDGYA